MTNRLLVWVFLISIWLAIIAPIYATLGNRQQGKINQTYNRATNCFAATSPTKRTPDYVKNCYDKAEAATGVKVIRYGDGN